MVKGKKIVCSNCKRHFADASALAQHRRDAHSGGARKRSSRPARPSGPSVARFRTITTSGSDLIGTFSVPVKTQVGVRVFWKVLSPREFVGSRLSQEAGLWSRWRPKKLTVRMTLAGSSNTFGTLCVCWDPDPTADWAGCKGDDAIRRAMALPFNKVVRLDGATSLAIPVEAARTWLQTTGELDQQSHGSVLGIVTGAPGGYAGAISGLLNLDWTVEWEGESPPDAISEIVDKISPDQGWTDLFTTSDGSWNDSVLTFKMHHGGDMAPWSAARHGIVYTVDDKTKVYYHDGASDKAEAKFFALIDGYAVPGLVMFSTVDAARDYIRTGDVSKCLQYKAAGANCTPSKLVLKNVASKLSSVASTTRVAELEFKVQQLTESLQAFNVVDTGLDDDVASTATSSRKLANMINSVIVGAKSLGINIASGPGTGVLDPVYVVNENPLRESNGTQYASIASGSSSSLNVQAPDFKAKEK